MTRSHTRFVWGALVVIGLTIVGWTAALWLSPADYPFAVKVVSGTLVIGLLLYLALFEIGRSSLPTFRTPWKQREPLHAGAFGHTWDVFISHASDDKREFVTPLAERLEFQGLRVWYDEFSLTLGDSLLRSIDNGLANSRFGVVVLSPAFFSKDWPQKELDGLVSREHQGQKVLLPVWYKVTACEVQQYSPILAGRLAVSADHGLDFVAAHILAAVAADAERLPFLNSRGAPSAMHGSSLPGSAPYVDQFATDTPLVAWGATAALATSILLVGLKLALIRTFGDPYQFTFASAIVFALIGLALFRVRPLAIQKRVARLCILVFIGLVVATASSAVLGIPFDLRQS